MRIARFIAPVLLLAACTGSKVTPLSGTTTSPSPSPATLEPSSAIPDRREFPVNTAVSPCENFYEYACSIPVSRFKLREDRSRHLFAFNDSAERILNSKKKYLGQLLGRGPLAPRTEQLKVTYEACMNESARKTEEQAQVEAVQATLANIETRGELKTLLGRQILSTEESFVSIDTDANLSDPTKYDLLPSPTVMSLPVKEYYAVPALITDYEALVKMFFETIGSKDAAAQAKQVIDFETRFAKTFPRRDEMHDRQGDKARIFSVDAIRNAYPNLRLNFMLAEVPQTTQLRNLFPESFDFLNHALNSEPLETLKSVYLFHALNGVLMDAYPTYFERKTAFNNKHLGGPPKLAERSERCTEQVMSGFEKELDAELVDVLFPNFPKDRFNLLANKVRQAIIRRLEKNTWLSAKGKEGALRKMRKARMQLVSPNNDQEWDFIEVAQYNASRPIANAKLRQSKSTAKMLAGLKTGRDWKRWGMGPLTVNAYYEPSDNKFVMLQGILQYPFFDPGASDAVNLGAVGVVIGHELGHGFDNNGSRYNEDGVLEAWLPEADATEFASRTSLLVEQFNGYVPASINDQYGKLTLGENIADTSGLQFGYEAAFPGNKGSVDDKKSFYLQYARAWCGTMRPKELERRWRSDFHAQTEKRVNGPLMHQAGFYEAYSCSAKDKMYLPSDRRMDLW
jgi:putative endopeptidase